MQNMAWIELFKVIPSPLHDTLIVTTTSGQEISVQNIVRLQGEYLVMRGRMSGTTDAGRLYLIPYDQINFIGFVKLLKEPEIAAIFNGGIVVPPAATAAPPPSGPTQAPVGTETEPPPAIILTPPAEPPPGHDSTKGNSKVVLLERVRARLAAQSKPQGG